MDRGNRIGAPARDGGRGVRLVGKRRRRPGTATAAATPSSPGPHRDHNQRVVGAGGAQLRVPRPVTIGHVQPGANRRGPAVRIQQPDRDNGTDRVPGHGVRSGRPAGVQKVRRQRVRAEGVPIRGPGAQSHAHRNHGPRRAPVGRRHVAGSAELRVSRARAQGVPGAEQPCGERAEPRVRSQMPRAGVRRGQRFRTAGAGRVRRGHSGRTQGGRSRFPGVRVREQHGSRIRGRRARVRHQRVPAAHGLADRGTGVRVPGPVAHRPSGLFHGLSAAHGPSQLGG